jgi:hypothetical protein
MREMIKNRKTALYTVGVVVLLLIAYFMRYNPLRIDNPLLGMAMIALRNTIHFSLLVAWSVSLHRRLMDFRIRRLLVSVGVMLVLWVTVKTVKYEFLVSNTDPIGRYMWYCFYIPMIMVPLFGVFIVDFIGKPEGYRSPKWMNVLYVPALMLLGCVLTNDLHQWVFRFDNGIENYDRDYSYGFPYFIAMAWFILLGIYFVVMLLKKCRVPGSKKMQKLPLCIMLVASGFWISYSLRIVKVDLTVVDCLIIALLCESAIQSGLIPSNTNYQQIFNATTVPIQVVDMDFQPHYVSARTLPVSELQLRQSAVETVNLGSSLLTSAPINAGRVVWQDDVSQINALRQRLQDMQTQLCKDNDLLQAEAEVKANRAKADEQNRLYDRITAEVEPQLIKAETLIHRIESDRGNTGELLPRLCVIGSYIKRRGNLLLLGEEDNRIYTNELEYCIRESLENLRLGGVFTSLISSCDGKAKREHIVSTYDFYEKMVEWLLDDITAMMVNLTCHDGTIQMNIQMGCGDGIAQQVLADVEFPYGSYTYDIMDEDVVINLTVSEGGACE